MALNVTIALAKKNGPGDSLASDTNLQLLDSALEEMSGTWTLAADARTKFGLASGPRAVPINPISMNENQGGLQSSSWHQQGENLGSNPESAGTMPDMSNMVFGSSNLQDSEMGSIDPYFWDPLGISDSYLTDWLGIYP